MKTKEVNFAGGNISKFFIPSIADIIFISLFIVLSFSPGKLLADGDTGYHIRAGEIILDTLTVPKYDIFSFHSPALPWTAHEWLSEVIMALVHRTSGLTGIVIFFAFLISSVYYLMFKMLQSYDGNILAISLIILLVAASSSLHWLARPHIFSLFFMVILYYLLDMYQYHDKNYLYCLPPLMLLWVNLHGGFMAGLILLGIYLLGNLAGIIFSTGNGRKVPETKFRMLGIIMFLCLVSALINPFGYHILLYPFKLTSSKFIMDTVVEFRSPNFHEFMPFTYLLLLMVAVTSVSGRALNIIQISLVLLFTYMSLYSVRYIPLFAVVVAPILLRQVDMILEKKTGRLVDFFKKRADNIAQVDRSARGLLWSIIAIAAVVSFVVKGQIVYGFDKEKKAVDAVEFLKKEHLKGHMFNDDEFGDYIIYSAYPQYKVFFDGRGDMYGTGRLKEYRDILFLKPGWEKILEKYEIIWIMVDPDSVLSEYLLASSDWPLIYSDKVASIFVKNIPENKYLIDKYGGPRAVIAKD